MTVRSALRAPVRAAVRAPIVLRKRPDPLRALIDSLFGNGEQGLIWLPRPQVLGQQALWQQSDGTVIVNADGDPIGRGEDVSGNDNDLTQSVSADRPLYKTDGTLHWASGDGSGDFISATIPTLDLVNNPFIVSVSGKYRSILDNGRFILSLSNGTDAGDWFGFRAISTGFIMRMADSGGSARDIAGPDSDTNEHVFTLTGGGQGTVSFYVDGVIQGGSSPSGLTVSKLGLYSLLRIVSTLQSEADINGLVFAMNGAQHRDDVEGYLAKLAGITL